MKPFAFVALAAVLVTVCSLVGAQQDARAQAFGMVSAVVEKTDDARGLTVRSEPSASASPVGFLPVGTEIKSCNDFRDGWVRLEIPSKGNWVNMSFLKPKGGEATVEVVDKPELCLAIRKGPYSSYEKIGCAELGQKLALSGVWSTTNWARLEDGGWVDASKIQTDLLVCSTPLVATPAPEPQVAAQSEPPAELSTVPAPSCDVSTYTECPPFAVGTLPAPIVLGDFGAFGYFPGVFPFISIGGGYYNHFHRGPYYGHHRGPYYGHHGGPYPGHRGGPYYGHHRRAPESMVPGNRRSSGVARTAVNRRATSMNAATRNAWTGINRSATNASSAFRSRGTGTGFSRASSGSVFRGTTGPGFRAPNFSSGRGMNVASFSSRAARGGGGSFRGGGGFRAGGSHGSGRRR